MSIKKKLLSILLSLTVVFQIICCCLPLASAASNKDTIFDFLRSELGYNTAVACGVLANIEKESNFNPSAYGDGGNSYGICQWNTSRFSSLKNYCNNNGYDWKSLIGQLYYLKYELTNGYKSINSKMKTYANSAQGAYDAGYRWCYDFEIPANRAACSAERGEIAKTKYWPLYSGEVSAPKITLTNPSAATTTINKGKSLEIIGTVSANGLTTTVNGYIKDASGKVLQSASATTSSTLTIKNSSIDNNLVFGKLAVGTYTLYITAKNSKGTVSVTKTVIVKDPNAPQQQAPASKPDVKPVVTPKVTAVKINDDFSISYKDKNTFALTPEITAETNAKYSVKWTSSDNKVATVDADGNLKALAKGNVTITCTVTDSAGNTVSDTCDVSVELKWWEWIIVVLLQGWAWYI